MSYTEYLSWVEFRKKHGPLNPILRADQSRAWTTLVLAKTSGAKSLELKDLLPYHKEDEAVEASIEEIAGAFHAVNRSNKVFKRS